jgi:hypothetical protein
MAAPQAKFAPPRLTSTAAQSVVFNFPNELDERCSGSLLFEFVPMGSGEFVEPRVTLRWWAGDFPRAGAMRIMLERACKITGRDIATVFVRSLSADDATCVTKGQPSGQF